jgi:hypothetical protein
VATAGSASADLSPSSVWRQTLLPPPSSLSASSLSPAACTRRAPRLASRRVAPLPPPTPRKARFETHRGKVGHVAPRADVQRGGQPLRCREQGPNQSAFLSRGPDAAHVAVCVCVCVRGACLRVCV